MGGIITREFINKNILHYDHETGVEYNYNDLCAEIDLFKNIFSQNLDKEVPKSIIVGIHPSIQQTACIFACFELGISICIIDYGRNDSFTQYNYIDPKTELLLPIDFFIVKNRSSTDKFDYFNKICKQTIILNELLECDRSPNTTINCSSNSILIRCTSSGTTNTPKIIEHTHEFLYHLAIRNSSFFDGNVAVCRNLNHGSSIATYFLPVLCSQKVQKIFNVNLNFLDTHAIKILDQVNHIMIPYVRDIENFIKSKNSTDIIIYTLTTIPSFYKKYHNLGKFKDVISFFGSNETSGPVLINKISSITYSPYLYYKIDDFYKIKISDYELHVSLPYYLNKVVNTNDRFLELDNSTFKFLGRQNLIKINGWIVDYNEYTIIVNLEGLLNSYIIFDIFENRLYLAIDKKQNDNITQIKEAVLNINRQINHKSCGHHNINKFALLDLDEFMTGVKIDHELLRHYFRKHVTLENL